MHYVKLIKLQILKQVAESKGADAQTIKLNKCLPATIITDFLVGQFLISPLLTMCWRSAWMLGDILMDQVVFPEKKNLGIMFSLFVGTCLTMLMRFVIMVPSSSSMPSIIYFAVSRVFTVIYFCCYMLLWRGWWSLLIVINGPKLIFLTIGILCLLIFGSLSTNVGPPLSVSHDTRLECQICCKVLKVCVLQKPLLEDSNMQSFFFYSNKHFIDKPGRSVLYILLVCHMDHHRYCYFLSNIKSDSRCDPLPSYRIFIRLNSIFSSISFFSSS